MPWDAHLQLDYTVEASRTVARHQHTGPLRILQSLYPEGDGICHNVLVHPPGGLVGGDTLDIHFTARGGAGWSQRPVRHGFTNLMANSRYSAQTFGRPEINPVGCPPLQLKLLATLMSPEPFDAWFCWRSCARP